MRKIVVLYHENCSDGFGAAWAAWKKFGNRAVYLPVKHQEPPPAGLKNKELYTLDFTYKGDWLKKLLRENNLTIIDHHFGVKKEIESAPRHLFALKHSGAVLAWQFFHPKKPAPWLLHYVEDRDLWKFKLAGTRSLLSVVDIAEFDFMKWHKIAQELENPKKRTQYIRQGKTVIEYQSRAIERLVHQASPVRFQGHKTLALNSPMLRSELGAAIIKKGYALAIIWHRKAGKIYVSLRSTKKVDVSKLAKRYGGGGHKQAAGFVYPAKKALPWKYIGND